MAEFELKISTAEARNHANEQKKAEQMYKNIVENLLTAKSQIRLNWEGDAADINDIIARIDSVTGAFQEAINPCLNQLHTGVTNYAEQIDKIGGNAIGKVGSIFQAAGATIGAAGNNAIKQPTPQKPAGQTSTAPTTAPATPKPAEQPKPATTTPQKPAEQPKPQTAPATTAPKPASSGGKAMDVPSGNTSYKSYTSYKKVASNTPQGAVVYGGKAAPYGKYKGTTYNTKTDPSTGVRYVTFEGDNTKYYCAAMGTYYGEVGDTFKVTTDNGNSYNVIMCDAKGSDAQGTHNGGTWYHSSGNNKCLTEFYVDTKQMPDSMKVYRNGSYIGTTGTYNSVPQFSGNVKTITKLS